MKLTITVITLLILVATGLQGPVSAANALSNLPIGIEEHLGKRIPMGLAFQDESGNTVTLGQLIKRPTVLSLVYFECSGLCTPLLNEEAKVLGQLGMAPGEQFDAITVSFNAHDTPVLASKKKQTYLNLVGNSYSMEQWDKNWHWLTGSQASIEKLTAAVGFRYKPHGSQFVHPACLFVLSPKGEITRYMYGTEQIPADLAQALIEASRGQASPTIDRLVRLCFSYDPASHKYVLNLTRVVGGTTLLTLVGFVFFLNSATKKRRAQMAEEFTNGGDGDGNLNG